MNFFLVIQSVESGYRIFPFSSLLHATKFKKYVEKDYTTSQIFNSLKEAEIYKFKKENQQC